MVITNEGVNQDEAYLQVIAVNPKMSGLRIGDSMMAHLEEVLIENNIKEISLALYSDNVHMSRFLDRWKFKELYRETVFIKEEKTKPKE
jgi:ribosomal protein S18 acetylase RimI-like enzyme